MIPKWLQDKMAIKKRVFHLKGKMGKIIANRDRASRLKRKRKDAIVGEVKQQIIDDEVFLPSDDMLSNEQVPADKKYVPIED